MLCVHLLCCYFLFYPRLNSVLEWLWYESEWKQRSKRSTVFGWQKKNWRNLVTLARVLAEPKVKMYKYIANGHTNHLWSNIWSFCFLSISGFTALPKHAPLLRDAIKSIIHYCKRFPTALVRQGRFECCDNLGIYSLWWMWWCDDVIPQLFAFPLQGVEI